MPLARRRRPRYHNLGFSRVIELEWWESFSQASRENELEGHLHAHANIGARARSWTSHRLAYGGFVLEYQGRKIYHAGDSAYFDGFKEIGQRFAPEIALLPIGAYHPETFRAVHMGPDEAVKAFRDLNSKKLIPMHFGTFRLSFEDMDEPLRWLRELCAQNRITSRLQALSEGVPVVF